MTGFVEQCREVRRGENQRQKVARLMRAGHSVDEIAAMLGRPRSTIISHVANARRYGELPRKEFKRDRIARLTAAGEDAARICENLGVSSAYVREELRRLRNMRATKPGCRIPPIILEPAVVDRLYAGAVERDEPYDLFLARLLTDASECIGAVRGDR